MTTKNEISAEFDRWNQAIQTGNPDSVTACYADDAMLLPTVSPKVRHNHAEIRDYFEHFLALKPVGRIIEQNIRIYGALAINSGLYNFLVTKDGVESEVAARFTFVYRKYEAGWMIVEHHSSLLPAVS